MPLTSPALDLAKRLNDDGTLTIGDNMFVAEWGDEGRQAMIMDAPPNVSRLQTSYEIPSIQILVRGGHAEAYIDVYEFAKTVYDAVIALPAPVSLNGTCYSGLSVEIPPTNLGQDERNRFVISMQFTTIRSI